MKGKHLKSITIMLAAMILLNKRADGQLYTTSGRITYEQTIYQWPLAESVYGQEQENSRTPKTITSTYLLYFTEKTALYGIDPLNKREDGKLFSFLLPTNDLYFTNYDRSTQKIKKNIFEQTFLISDTLPVFNWKIGRETRTIAGFTCRKAVGLFLDSLEVIAFYTDEIVPPGGPRSFRGLPGMIMGVAIPTLHTTWYAQKLERMDYKTPLASTPVGKYLTKQNYITLLDNFSMFGQKGATLKWFFLL